MFVLNMNKQVTGLNNSVGEVLPSGSFFGMSKEEYAAMQNVDKIANIINSYDKITQDIIVEQYKSKKTQKELAQEYLKETFKKYPVVAEKAMGKWLRMQLGDEAEKIRMKKLRTYGKKNAEKDPEKMVSNAKKGAEKLWEKHGGTDFFKENAIAGVLRRGLVPRTEEEKATIYLLINTKSKKEIVSFLNKKFHGGGDIRTVKSITDVLYKDKIRNLKKPDILSALKLDNQLGLIDELNGIDLSSEFNTNLKQFESIINEIDNRLNGRNKKLTIEINTDRVDLSIVLAALVNDITYENLVFKITVTTTVEEYKKYYFSLNKGGIKVVDNDGNPINKFV